MLRLPQGWMGCALPLALGIGLAGCTCEEAPESRTTSSASRAEADAPDVPPKPAPAVEITAESSHDGTRAEVRLINRAGEQIQLGSPLEVERWTDGSWQPTQVRFDLRLGCDTPAPRCFELVPGAELAPPAWLSTGAPPPPCGCEACAPLPPGRYRFVARSCDPAQAPAIGAPFDLQAPAAAPTGTGEAS